MKNIYLFVGTTAELIKVAPVIKEFKIKKTKFKLVATGQNDINFKEFEWYFGKVKPDITLKYKSTKSSIFYFIFWAVRTFLTSVKTLNIEFSNLNKSKTILVVHGDTVSSLIGAVTAKLLGVKLAHIESGLRSFNYLEPFPEEISRVIISKLADIHFCPNQWAAKNLRYEKGKKIITGQNTSYQIINLAIRQKHDLSKSEIINGKYFILIMHRQEHVLFGKDESLEIMKYILENTSLKCLLLSHDISKDLVDEMAIDKTRVIRSDRKNYLNFIDILKNSEFIATDGGSNQEEAYFLGLPCLILRKHTERTEGLHYNAILSQLNRKIIYKFLKKYKEFKKKKPVSNKVPSEIIFKALINHE